MIHNRAPKKEQHTRKSVNRWRWELNIVSRHYKYSFHLRTFECPKVLSILATTLFTPSSVHLFSGSSSISLFTCLHLSSITDKVHVFSHQSPWESGFEESSTCERSFASVSAASSDLRSHPPKLCWNDQTYNMLNPKTLSSIVTWILYRKAYMCTMGLLPSLVSPWN